MNQLERVTVVLKWSWRSQTHPYDYGYWRGVSAWDRGL